MPIDFTKPATTDNYSTGFVPNINNAIKALGAMLDPTYAGTITSAPAGTKRLNAGAFQEYNGTTWAALAMDYALKAGDTFTGAVTVNGSFTTSSSIYQPNAAYLRSETVAGNTTRIIGLNSGDNLYVGSVDQPINSILFSNNGSTLMTLSATGYLGIGATPSYPLDVRLGDIRAYNAAASVNLRLTATATSGAGSSNIIFNNNAGADTAQISSGSGGLSIYTAGTLRWRTTQAGDITPQVDATYDIGSSSLHWATVYADTFVGAATDATKLPLAGGTLTGLLTLSGAPTTGLHAATKTYADLMLPKLGGTMTGDLIVNGGRAYTTEQTVTFSATPTFAASNGNFFVLGNLTGNVTGMTVSGAQSGQFITIRVKQDATGGRTVAEPAGSQVAGSVNLGASKTSYLSLTYNTTDSRWEGSWLQIG